MGSQGRPRPPGASWPPSGSPTSTVTTGRPPLAAAGALATGSDSGPAEVPSVTAATAYSLVRPGSPEVSAYGPAGTASTSPPPWSSTS